MVRSAPVSDASSFVLLKQMSGLLGADCFEENSEQLEAKRASPSYVQHESDMSFPWGRTHLFVQQAGHAVTICVGSYRG